MQRIKIRPKSNKVAINIHNMILNNTETNYEPPKRLQRFYLQQQGDQELILKNKSDRKRGN